MNLKNFAQSWKYHLIVLVSAILTIVIGAYIRNAVSGDEKQEPSVLRSLQTEVQQLRSTLRRNELKTIEQDIAEAARDVLPRVVSITGGSESAPPIVTLNDTTPELRRFSSSGDENRPGVSGMLLDGEGHILTTSRAVEARTNFVVTFADVTQRPASLVAAEEQLALLKLEQTEGLAAPAELSAPPPPQPGNWLIRLGREGAGREGLSMGLLTAIRRDFEGRDSYLLDSRLAPELDGGPAIDLDGRIVGINIMLRGEGLTIPIDRAMKVIESLKSGRRKTPKSSIGIELQDLTDEMKRFLKVERGALITAVMPGSSASRAGLLPMDVVTGVGGQPVASAGELIGKITAAPAGTKLQLNLNRAGVERTLEVETSSVRKDAAGGDDFGIRLFREQNGVRVTEVLAGSPAQKLGLRPGDRILTINGRPVRGFTDFQSPTGTGQVQLWLIRRGEQTFCITIREVVEGVKFP